MSFSYHRSNHQWHLGRW